MKLLAALAIITLGLTPCRADVYTIRPDISEAELNQLYIDMLLEFSRYAETFWHDHGDGLGYWGTGRSNWHNEGIRAISTISLTYALLAKETNVLSPAEQKHYLDRAVAAIRYAARTHKTGDLTCTDGKQWGDTWGSTLWTASLGLGAWITWNDLDDDLRASVENVVTHDADALLERMPLGCRIGDTKAEENAWDQMVVSLAANMFPHHPNAPAWREKSVQFMMNTLSVPRDLTDTTLVDGKRVKDWVCAVNVHPDFTLENHGFFHPAYAMVSPAMIGQGAFYYAYAGNRVPEAASHHLAENWRVLQEFMLPHGFWAYVQGMDWALNSDSHIHYLAWLSTYARDPLASGMEKIVAQYLAGHQKVHGNGTFAGPSSRLGFAREAITAGRIAYSYLYHRHIAQAPQPGRTIRDAADELNAVRRYPIIDTITQRTGSKFVAFSWRNRVMGYVMPIGEGHSGNPYFSTPITNGMVGRFVLSGGSKALSVEEHTWRRLVHPQSSLDDGGSKGGFGFETRGVLSTNGGSLKQELVLVSAGERTVIYADRVKAERDVEVREEMGAPVGIQNDEFTGNRRTLYYDGGHQVITGPGTREVVRIDGNWANVDGRLGVVSLLGAGIAYRDVSDYNRNGAREDFLYGSYSDAVRRFKAGSEVARRAVVVYVETSPEETARLASQVRLEKTGSGESTMVVPLPEGGEYTLELGW